MDRIAIIGTEAQRFADVLSGVASSSGGQTQSRRERASAAKNRPADSYGYDNIGDLGGCRANWLSAFEGDAAGVV
ncbi:hypothetical protein [Mycolicibacterium brisbanense]|uniref:hypothetical protein n=1 Tax=Mycolicibacterium brisbanense TaxID=146020 RepID=UPI0007A0849C|nr:hypothetical protein [Mycolicibacterium brisbanense]